MSKSTGINERRAAETEMMVNLYTQGKTISFIAKLFDKKMDTVSSRLDRAGVRVRRVMGQSGTPYSASELATIANFVALPWNRRNWRELMNQLPGRSRGGVETIIRRLKQQREQFAPKKREHRDASLEAAKSGDIPEGYYRHSNGAVLKHISLQGDMSALYKPQVSA